jgi:hypothetical protein
MTESPQTALAESLFSLDEPWRSRFLSLVTDRASNYNRERRLPTESELITWLNDGDFYQEIRALFRIWSGRRL